MTTLTINQVQRDFLIYLGRVQAGETIVIEQAGKRVAELRPVVDDGHELRPMGLCAGEFHHSVRTAAKKFASERRFFRDSGVPKCSAEHCG